MSFPAARWRCQLIGRGRGPRAGLGASLAAASAQLSGKNWGGCCGEISYRSLGGAAGPRSALTAADPAGPREGASPRAARSPPPLPAPAARLPARSPLQLTSRRLRPLSRRPLHCSAAPPWAWHRVPASGSAPGQPPGAVGRTDPTSGRVQRVGASPAPRGPWFGAMRPGKGRDLSEPQCLICKPGCFFVLLVGRIKGEGS